MKEESITTVPYNADFYIATATIIPVIFLALILEGGLWAWIAGRISTGNVITMPVRIFVSILQLFAVAVLLAGTVSEILALSVLLHQSVNVITENIIYYSTIFLIVLLGITLLSKVPGVFVAGIGTISLDLEDEEELLWSGRCARLALTVFTVINISPWLWGRFFLTNKRVVWMTSKELGLAGAPTIKIDFTGEAGVGADAQSPGWTRHLPSNSLGVVPRPPRGYFFNLITGNGKKYHFCTSVKESEFEKLMQLLTQSSAKTSSIEPIKPSGTGWPIN